MIMPVVEEGKVIKPGDVVQLKSGGPKMTVTQINQETVWCKWFDGEDVKTGHFPVFSLKPTSEDQ